MTAPVKLRNRALREVRRGLSYQATGALLGVSAATVARWVRLAGGKYVEPPEVVPPVPGTVPGTPASPEAPEAPDAPEVPGSTLADVRRS